MRKILILLCCIIGYAATAQNSYFVDKKGTKTIVRDDAIEIIVIDKRVSYKQVGKTWEKYITYKDLDYVIMGPYVFKTFRFGKSKKDEGFFIRAETAEKKLLTVAVTVTTTSSSGRMSSSITHYRAVVADNNNTILDEVKFTSSRSDDEGRAMAVPMVMKHFSDCPSVVAQMTPHTYSPETVSQFFDSPMYINCK
ncbi:MAG TPA: hypothetical protein VGB50_00170 [Flavobacterium sp.]|jgi:hypothetical protein